ncbi:MAG: alpha-amylase family glycosyl hydrolase, partial [Phycisphaerae bacterium]
VAPTPDAVQLKDTLCTPLTAGLRWTLHYTLGATNPNQLHTPHYYDVYETVDFLDAPERIERTLTIRRAPGVPPPSEPTGLRSATLLLDGLQLHAAPDTTCAIPMARHLPDTPWRKLLDRPRLFDDQHPLPDAYDVVLAAPDGITGTVSLSSPQHQLQVMVTPLPQECPAHVRLYGEQGRLILEQEFACESWLADTALLAARQVIQVTPQTGTAGLRAVGQYLQSHGYAPPSDRPAWVLDACVLEIEPEHFGGLPGLLRALPEIHACGFNTLYLLPWHTGGYGTLDYRQINPKYGTFDDLIALTAEAHRLGLRVLFDLLVNVTSPQSPYVQNQPDWFYRDDAGRVLPHPVWTNCCLDAASPSFRRFLLDYALWCCDTLGADGFRVDAVAYRGGLWHNRPGIQPHQHSHAVFTLVEEIRRTIRVGHPDRILMAECFGPQQVPISDLVCYQWIVWLDWALDKMASGQWTGQTIQRQLADHFAVMPTNTFFTLYTHTHDTVWFSKHEFDGPAVSAYFAALALLGGACMTFAGGCSMRPRPTPGTERNEYQALLAARHRLGGVAGSAVEFVTSAPPALLWAQRPSALGPVHVITNFSPVSQPLPLTGTVLYSRLNSPPGQLAPYDTAVILPTPK